MNPRLRDYTRCPDGHYRRRVEFNIGNSPDKVKVVHLVRSQEGELLKAETVGIFYKKGK